jgi:UDP-N-acetylmuramoylalanine--D-glutamate ligase
VELLEKSARPANPHVARDLEAMGVNLSFGPHAEDAVDGADLIVPSPGIPPATPILERAARLKLPVISEIELAFGLTQRPMVAVTGTNGKTTTVTLIGEILSAGGLGADVCGNIGRPVSEVLDNGSGPLVLEVSSFQLEFTDSFRPAIAVLLNLTEDHLDWHGTFEAYKAAKLKIFQRQTADDWALIGPAGFPLVKDRPSRKLTFGGAGGGVFLKDGHIVHDMERETMSVLPVNELLVRGDHNLINCMAAVGVGLLHGVPSSVMAEVLRAFKGVEHRLELVTEDGGVLFYNDSKATNPEAAVKAIEAFDQGIILLAGGRNKGAGFDELAAKAVGRVRTAVLFGESAGDLRRAFEGQSIPTIAGGSLEEAVRLAIGEARSGDVVLLSPACASFDLFRDYEERGRCFKEAVVTEVSSHGSI